MKLLTTVMQVAMALNLGRQCHGAPASHSDPTFALVAGAFHKPWSMKLLSNSLQQAGHSTTILGLVTVDHAQLTVSDDVNEIMWRLLNPLINYEGKNVLLYLHSYAGFPGSAAIQGFSKAERLARGLEGGIIGLVYQSALIPLQNQTVVEEVGGAYPPWVSPQPNGLLDVINPKSVFYNDVPEPLATKAVRHLRPQSAKSFNAASGPVYYQYPYYDDRRAYLHTELDQAIPPSAQTEFVADSGVSWDVRNLNTSHSPFLSEPAALALLLESIAAEFEATY